MAIRFNVPPGWPPPPEGFTPDPGWRPDPNWPPAPPGWQFWVVDDQDTPANGGTTPGYTGYGQAAVPAWSPTAPPSSTSGLAIAAFVLGLVGIAGIGAILGIVFGIVALRNIRRTGQQGKGLAIAGIVLGGCWVALTALVVGAGLVAFSTLSLNSAGPGSPLADPITLPVGACFVDPIPQPVTAPQAQLPASVLQTPCNVPHNGQIFATFTVSGSSTDYPGSAKMLSIASGGCTARAQASLNRTMVTEAMKIRYRYPLEASWRTGHRTVSCMVVSPAPTLTSSLLTSKLAPAMIR